MHMLPPARDSHVRCSECEQSCLRAPLSPLGFRVRPRNGVRLIRLRYGTFDWTGPGAEAQLCNLLASGQAPVSQPATGPTAQAAANLPVGQIRKVAVVSHDYNVTDSRGLYDYLEHFARINKQCDEQGCDTILYALFTLVSRLIRTATEPAGWM